MIELVEQGEDVIAVGGKLQGEDVAVAGGSAGIGGSAYRRRRYN